MKPYPAVSLADDRDEIGHLVYRQFMCHVLDFALRCDDVVYILMVKFDTYQIQMDAMISDFMFCTYKLWTP
jgi:hypothetical protein